MRRIMKWIFALVVVLVLIPSAVILLALPSKWEHSRSTTINASSDTIHEWVRDMKFWEKWHPFADQIPGAEVATFGSTRRVGDGISILRPMTDAFLANPKDPAAIDAETKAREAWRKSQDERREKIAEMRSKSVELLDKAYDRRKHAMAASSESRNAAEMLMREAPLEEHVEVLTKALALMKRNASASEWAPRMIDLVNAVLATPTKKDAAAVVRDLYDQIKREKATSAWALPIVDNIDDVRDRAGVWKYVERINDLGDIGSELKRASATLWLADKLDGEARASKYGDAMKEAAGLLRVAALDMEKAQAEIKQQRAEAKQLESDADDLDAERRKDWFVREIGSITLLAAQKRQVSAPAQKLMVALEATGLDKLTRSQYLKAIAAAGISEKDADAARVDLRDASFVNVVPRPDRLVIDPKKSLPNATVDDVSLLVQLGQVWKEVFADNWVKLSKDLLTPTEADEGMRMLLEAGVVHFEKHKNEYTFQNLRDLDVRSAPALSPVAVKALIVLLAVDTKATPYTKYTELVAPGLGRERMDAALKRLIDAGVLRIDIGSREEVTELTRKEGTGFRFVFGNNSRMVSQFQITYRADGENKTVVTWRGHGLYKSNPVHRVVGYMSNDTVAAIMERGLESLKKLAESGPPPEDE